MHDPIPKPTTIHIRSTIHRMLYVTITLYAYTYTYTYTYAYA